MSSSLRLLGAILAVHLFHVPAKASAASSETVLCENLRTSLGNDTYLPANPRYPVLRTENWSQTAWAFPACIVTPRSSQELGAVVNHLVTNDIHFAIRSGGHTPSPGAANINDGVLIDMSSFNQISYNLEDNTSVVGSGLTWGDVYTALEPFNVTVVGGRVLDVGVGGLILGSGLSYLSDKYGLACDNVVSFEVVLANGSIVTASHDENSELFWGLKGGTNNFGIVTTFTLSTYPLPQVWGGSKFYTNDQLPAMLNALADYQANYQNDSKSNLIIQSAVSNNSVGSLITFVYLEPVESPLAFSPFYNISSTLDTTAVQSWIEFLGGQILTTIPRWDFRATSFRPSSEIYQKILAIVRNTTTLSAIQNLNSGSITLGVQPISPNLVNAGIVRGSNALNLNPVSQTWFALDTGWEDAEDDAAAYAVPRQMMAQIEEMTKEEDVYLDYIFMNDASWDQDVIASYGVQNVRRLKEVQRAYDPQMVFQRLVSGGFKLHA